MVAALKVNKHGQALGRKGHETRLRLMEAMRRLLKKNSPVTLTAVAIAKEAKTSSATFYIYFNDVKDVLHALSVTAEAEMEEVIRIVEEPWDPIHMEIDHAERVVKSYVAIWDRHREVMRFRNLEADRGDQRFERLRLRTAIPMVNRFAEKILMARPRDSRLTRADAFAEASVLVAAMERLAAVDPKLVREGVGFDQLWAATARVIARSFVAPGIASEARLARRAPRKARSRG